MEIQNVFQRYELKYMLTAKQKEKVLAAMSPYMKQDEFGRSTIRNIYYDTPNHLLIRRSLEKPVYKEKLRVRSYGQADEKSTVFLELKKKYEAVVYKRRVSVSLEEAMSYLNDQKPLSFQNQITAEIDYFCQIYGQLQPAVFLTYEREAFYGKQDHELRMTFDEQILWREEDCSLKSGIYGKPILEPGYTLLEIKVGQGIPLWLVSVLSEQKIYQTSLSKYGAAYTQMMQRKLAGKKKRLAGALQQQPKGYGWQCGKEVGYVTAVI